MEDQAVQRLAAALEAEREMTAELLRALEAERAGIVAGRVEELYAACRHRAELTERVLAAQEDTARAIEAAGGEGQDLSAAIRRVARGRRSRLRQLRADINRLRRQVALLSEENRSYVGEALAYIDAAVSILTGVEAQPRTYGGEPAKSGPAVISSEV